MCSMAMLESLSLGRSMSRFFTSHAYFCARRWRLPCAVPTLHLQNIALIKCTSTLQVPTARATCQMAVWYDSAHPSLLGMQPACRSALQSGQAASPPPRRSHRTKRGNVIAVIQPFVHAACCLQGEAERAGDRPACPPAARAGPVRAAPGLAVAAGRVRQGSRAPRACAGTPRRWAGPCPRARSRPRRRPTWRPPPPTRTARSRSRVCAAPHSSAPARRQVWRVCAAAHSSAPARRQVWRMCAAPHSSAPARRQVWRVCAAAPLQARSQRAARARARGAPGGAAPSSAALPRRRRRRQPVLAGSHARSVEAPCKLWHDRTVRGQAPG